MDAEADPNPFRYCGEYFDTETQEVYLRARYYDPSTGRFTSEDPARDGGNWYNYCDGNPVAGKDPSGLFVTGTNPLNPAGYGNNLPNWAKYAIGGIIIAGTIAGALLTGSTVLAGAAIGSSVGSVVGIVVSDVDAKANGLSDQERKDANADAFFWGALGGGAMGALAGSGMPAGASMAAGAAVNLSLYMEKQHANGEDLTLGGGLWALASGAVSGLGGPLINGNGGSAISGLIGGVFGDIVEELLNSTIDEVLDTISDRDKLKIVLGGLLPVVPWDFILPEAPVNHQKPENHVTQKTNGPQTPTAKPPSNKTNPRLPNARYAQVM